MGRKGHKCGHIQRLRSLCAHRRYMYVMVRGRSFTDCRAVTSAVGCVRFPSLGWDLAKQNEYVWLCSVHPLLKFGEIIFPWSLCVHFLWDPFLAFFLCASIWLQYWFLTSGMSRHGLHMCCSGPPGCPLLMGFQYWALFLLPFAGLASNSPLL